MSKPFLFPGSPAAGHMFVVMSYRHVCMKGSELTEIEKVGVKVFESAAERGGREGRSSLLCQGDGGRGDKDGVLGR